MTRKENLPFSAGEPSPALSSSARAGPPQAGCGASRPRLPPTGHAGPRARERARRKGARVSLADQPSRGESIREEKRREEEKSKRKRQEEEPRGRAKRKRARPARVRPLWSGAPPFAPPRFGLHLPSGSFPKRGVPHSRQRHPARLPIGGEPPQPASVTLLGEHRRAKSARLLELL